MEPFPLTEALRYASYLSAALGLMYVILSSMLQFMYLTFDRVFAEADNFIRIKWLSPKYIGTKCLGFSDMFLENPSLENYVRNLPNILFYIVSLIIFYGKGSSEIMSAIISIVAPVSGYFAFVHLSPKRRSKFTIEYILLLISSLSFLTKIIVSCVMQ